MLSSEFKAVAVESLSPNSRYFCSSCCVVVALSWVASPSCLVFCWNTHKYFALFHELCFFNSEITWKSNEFSVGRTFHYTQGDASDLIGGQIMSEGDVYLCRETENHLTHGEDAIIAFLGSFNIVSASAFLRFCAFIAFPWRSHFGFESFFIEAASHWLSNYAERTDFMWGLITQVGGTMSVLSCFR